MEVELRTRNHVAKFFDITTSVGVGKPDSNRRFDKQ
jgi:hypothetical protein